MPVSSKYDVFIDNFSKGIDQVRNSVSGSFFERINLDKETIKQLEPAGDIAKRIAQIDLLEDNSKIDNYYKLKATSKILLDLAPYIWNDNNIQVKRSAINIVNSFFEIAKQTEDDELLQTAADISTMIRSVSNTVAQVPAT